MIAWLTGKAVSEFNLYRGDPVATVDRALAAAPKFVCSTATSRA